MFDFQNTATVFHCNKTRITPRIIIHGGAGNITRQNLTNDAYQTYRQVLLGIVKESNDLLQRPGATCLDVATHAVTLLENSPLFNAGHGAVFTRAGTHELEASVMVSRGYRKRGVGVMKVSRVKNPILLAKEMLVRGEADDGGGAGQHCQIEGKTCDRLAEQWGLTLVNPSYFWTRRRWDEHRIGLGLSHGDEEYEQHRRKADQPKNGEIFQSDSHLDHNEEEMTTSIFKNPTWDGKEYLPQGTVGCVVLDETGTLCVATSTGGLTNKLPGRIGDTPTLGAGKFTQNQFISHSAHLVLMNHLIAGFWAEEWQSTVARAAEVPSAQQRTNLSSLIAMVSDCLPRFSVYMTLPFPSSYNMEPKTVCTRRGVAMSGTGNGDSFLRVNAVRTAAAMARFVYSPSSSCGNFSLQDAVSAVAGPSGTLQQSAGHRWRKTGEGEGGIIGIEITDGIGTIVADFNCGGMFRAWIDNTGEGRVAVFREDETSQGI